MVVGFVGLGIMGKPMAKICVRQVIRLSLMNIIKKIQMSLSSQVQRAVL